MATSPPSKQQLHYEFVGGLPKDYECPVCLDAVYGAKQTACCGHHLCETCSERLTESPCPVCKKTPLVTVDDVYFRRKLNDLKVYCPHRGKMYKYKKDFYDPERSLPMFQTRYQPQRAPSIVTCNSQCDLRDIQSHLDKDCPLQPVTCRYKCDTTDLKRFEIENHENKICKMRPYKCSYCPHKAKAIEIDLHNKICPKVPVLCPNGCTYDKMSRESLIVHLTQCPLQGVSCEFAYAGCTVVPTRREHNAHIEESVKDHLKLLAAYGARKDKEIEDIKMRLTKLETKLR